MRYGLPVLLACKFVPETEWKFFLALHSTGSEQPTRTVPETKGNWFALVFHPVQQLCVIKLNFCHYVTSLVIVTDTLDALTVPLFLPDSFESDVIDPPRGLPSPLHRPLLLFLFFHDLSCGIIFISDFENSFLPSVCPYIISLYLFS